ncbi:MAG TPA: ElyC/SanA/YdcF family protein, partial [Aggregatilineales bacterium]|nr:ElyC/SanA/YdcF family protein [Aggregatilineales bacterium]
MPFRRMGCWLMLLLISGIVLLIGLPFALRAYTALRFADDVYSVDKVPPRQVAVIFGAQVLRSGRLSTMLRDRVATGADLYHAGKVEKLLMSGDNRSPDYNEPEAMRDYALRLGVPEDAILLDRQGLRTYDSCFRAREAFG